MAGCIVLIDLIHFVFMKFEHYAINVEDSVKVADWYITHCGLTAAVAMDGAPYTRFLADDTGRVFLEIYSNFSAAIPDYAAMHQLIYHLAFAVTDAGAEQERLMAAGCTFVEELNPQPNSRLIMLRDPFGIPLQLCQRANPMS
jgi:glyoxylase I family protein